MISFNDQIDFLLIEEDKSYNLNENYTDKNIHLNRVLYRMEKFFRKMNLLEKGEMLSIERSPQKHIRSPFIDCIAYKMKWIYPDEYVHVISK
jgi:hypothetical protein